MHLPKKDDDLGGKQRADDVNKPQEGEGEAAPTKSTYLRRAPAPAPPRRPRASPPPARAAVPLLRAVRRLLLTHSRALPQ